MYNSFINKNISFKLLCYISFILGGLVFISIFGVKVVNPFNADWLLNAHFNVKMEYIAWEFFRNTPWSFPFGLFNDLSYPDVTSVLNTDSIPLFALLFKIFSPILPEKFQYFGLYCFLSFCLQSMLGMIICKKYCENNILGNLLAVMGGLLFTIVPIITNYCFVQCGHTSHWLILLAFIPFVYYNEYSDSKKISIYIITAILSVLINPYFTAFCAIILFAYCLYDYLNKKNLKKLLILPVYFVISVLCFALIGGFSMNTVLSEFDFVHLFNYGFKLNVFFNPMNTSSIFKSSEAYDGYMYLGAGVILLIITAFISFGYYREKQQLINKKMAIALLIMVMISFYLSLSPVIRFGQTALFEINYPDFIINTMANFRIPERFMWVTYYLLIIISFKFILKIFNVKTVLAVLFVILSIQIFDLHGWFSEYHRSYSNLSEEYNNRLFSNEIWSKFPENRFKTIYADILFTDFKYNGLTNYDNIMEIAQFAYTKGLKLNNYYFAKTIKNKNKEFIKRLIAPENSDLFVFYYEAYPKEILLKSQLKFFYMVGGLLIAAKNEIPEFNSKKISIK